MDFQQTSEVQLTKIPIHNRLKPEKKIRPVREKKIINYEQLDYLNTDSSQSNDEAIVHHLKEPEEKITLIERAIGYFNAENDLPAQNNSLNLSICEGPPFICKICSNWFYMGSKLKLHYILNHKIFHCEVCSILFENLTDKNTHLTQFHSPIFCEICQNYFENLNVLLTHYEHDHDSTTCPFCGILLQPSNMAHNHIIRKHSVFPKFLELRKNVVENVENSVTEFFCGLCNKNRENEVFFGHMNSHHKLNINSLLNLMTKLNVKISVTGANRLDVECERDEKEVYKNSCPVCLLRFTKKIPENFHLIYCQSKMQCRHCEKHFSNTTYLDKHMDRAHMKFLCKQGCDKFAYNSDENLYKHYVKFHESIPCRYCETFITISNFDDHLLSEHKYKAVIMKNFNDTLFEVTEKQNKHLVICCLCDENITLLADNIKDIFQHYARIHSVTLPKILALIGPKPLLEDYEDFYREINEQIKTEAGENGPQIQEKSLDHIGLFSGANLGLYSASHVGQNMDQLGKNLEGNAGGNFGSIGQNSGLIGLNSGLIGQNSGLIGQNGQESNQAGQNIGQIQPKSGQTRQKSGQTGQSAQTAHSGQTGQSSGQTGQKSGQTGQKSGQTGQSSGQIGQSSGQTEHSGQTGQHSPQIDQNIRKIAQNIGLNAGEFWSQQQTKNTDENFLGQSPEVVIKIEPPDEDSTEENYEDNIGQNSEITGDKQSEKTPENFDETSRKLSETSRKSNDTSEDTSGNKSSEKIQAPNLEKVLGQNLGQKFRENWDKDREKRKNFGKHLFERLGKNSDKNNEDLGQNSDKKDKNLGENLERNLEDLDQNLGHHFLGQHLDNPAKNSENAWENLGKDLAKKLGQTEKLGQEKLSQEKVIQEKNYNLRQNNENTVQNLDKSLTKNRDNLDYMSHSFGQLKRLLTMGRNDQNEGKTDEIFDEADDHDETEENQEDNDDISEDEPEFPKLEKKFEDYSHLQHEITEDFDTEEAEILLNSDSEIEDDIEEFSCEFCPEKQPKIVDLLKHMNEKHKLKSKFNIYDCKYCPEVIISYKEHANHLIEQHSSANFDFSKEMFNCSCKTYQVVNSLARNHILNVHKEDLAEYNVETLGLKCKFCEKKYWERTETNAHEIEEHFQQNQMDFQKCFKCLNIFSSQKCLASHSHTEHPEIPVYSKFIYKCLNCTLAYPDINLLRAHFRSEHPASKIYKCPVPDCFKICKKEKYLLSHLKRPHGKECEQEAFCDICGKRFKSYKAATIHKLMKHERDRAGFQCRICNERFATSEQRKLHYTTAHPGQLAYNCLECGKGFISKSGLYGHRKIHQQNSNLICPYCSKEFTRRDSYNEHLLIHIGPRHQCPHCPKSFTQRSNLTRHVRIHTGAKPYQCCYCEKRFSDRGACRSHERVHTKEEHCECSYCGKKFTKKQKLKYHLRFHTGEGLLECETCSKQFSNTYSLNEHRRIHNQDTLIMCDCGRGFSSEKYLNRHMQNVHKQSGTKYVCPICFKPIFHKSSYNDHIMTHSAVKHVRCLLCNKEYNTKKTVKRHIQEQHNLRDSSEIYKHIYQLTPQEAGLNLPPANEIAANLLNEENLLNIDIKIPEIANAVASISQTTTRAPLPAGKKLKLARDFGANIQIKEEPISDNSDEDYIQEDEFSDDDKPLKTRAKRKTRKNSKK